MRSRILKMHNGWKLILFLALFYLLFEIIYIIKIKFFLSLSNQTIPWYALGAYGIDWILVTCYMVVISIHTKHLLNRKIAWSKIIPLHILFSVLISVIIRFVIDFYQVAVGAISLQNYTFKTFTVGLMHNIDVNFLIYSAMIFIIYSFYHLEQVRISEAQKNVLETQLLSTRIKMLTTQLQPHFLFNTLNSISSLIDIDKSKAQDTLVDLSSFLRQVLFHIDSNFITIKKEFQILESYLNILRTRFQDQISIRVVIQPNLAEQEIPTLLMQPVVENAVKHGTRSSSRLSISISVFSEHEWIFLEVRNTGKLEEEDGRIFKKGMGLSNLKVRLSNIYGSAFSLNIANTKDGSGVLCQIKIPFEPEAKNNKGQQ